MFKIFALQYGDNDLNTTLGLILLKLVEISLNMSETLSQISLVYKLPTWNVYED